MVKIEKLQPYHLKQVHSLEVAEEQLQYVDRLADILLNVSDLCHPHVVIANNVVVGLFLIDMAYAKNHDFCSINSTGLRNFFISSEQQGKGFAKEALLALTPYLQTHYSQYSSIYLTVNCKNSVAYHCYSNANFDDMHAMYLGGNAGPQHIMRAEIT